MKVSKLYQSCFKVSCQNCLKVDLKCRIKVVMLYRSYFKSCLKPDSGRGGGGVQGDGHHHQEQKSFQRHRDWLLNIFVCQFVLR